MTSLPFSGITMTENLWRGIIVILSGAVILFTIWCLSNGITTIFMHLYYFPIVLLAYRYRWKGFGLATLLAFAYPGLVIVFDAGQADVPGAVYRVLVFVGIAAVIAYLSERLATETRIVQEAAELRDRYLSLAPAIILTLDRNGAITFLNQKGGEILECLPDEAVGKPWAGLFIPEKDRDRVREVFGQLMAGQVEPNRVVENLILTPGGTEKIIRWYNTVLHDENGAIAGILGFGEDITEEKRAQETLRKMQQFQESVIANANVWISVLAPDGTLLVWNDAAEVISGYKKSDVVGKNTVWKQLYPDKEYRKKVTGEIQRIIRLDDFLENFETEIHCADRTKKTIVWNTRSIGDAEGKVTGYVAIGRDISAQKAAESRAAESSRFLGIMIDTLPIPVFFKDVSGKYLGCNPPFEEYIGIKRDQLIGKTVFDISPHDLADRYAAADRQLFDNPVLQQYETQVEYADGSRHDVIFFKAPFFNKDGSVAGLIGAFLDITERKRTELALRESEETYRAFFSTSRDCVFITTTDGRWVDFNDAAVELFGYVNRDDLLTMKISQMYANPGDRAAHIAYIRENGYSFEFPVDLQKKDGTILHTLVTSVARKDVSGNITGFQGSVRDISERTHIEEKLRASEEKFREIFNNINDAVHLHEIEPDGCPGRFLDVNDAACRMLMISRDELLAHNPLDYATEYHNPPLDEVTEQLRTRGTATFETGHRRADGTIVPVEINAHVITLMGKTVVLSAIRDLTYRKKAEEELRVSNVILSTQQETSPDGILIVDETGKILDYNQSFISIMRIPEDLIAARTDEPVLQHVTGQTADPDTFLSRVRYLYDHRDEKSQEEILLRDGRVLERYSAPMVGEDNRYFGRVWYFHDISERKQAEEALLRSEEWYRTLAEALPDQVFIDGRDGTIQYVNTASLKLLHCSPDQVIGKLRNDVFPPEIARVQEESIRSVFETGDPVRREDRIRFGEQESWIDASLVPLKDKAGTVTAVLGVAHDITGRKHMEEQLQASRQLFADIISFLPDPTFVIDKEGKVLAWNRAIEQLSGVSSGAILGKGDFVYSLWMYGKQRPILIDLVLHPEQDFARMNYTAIQVDGQTVTGQTQIVLPTGRNAVLSLIASPLFDSQGAVVGAIESIRDITRIKETEAELERLNQNLEETIRDRTKELTDSERKYRTLFDKTRDAFLIIENNKFVDCNASALQMLGYKSREELFQTHPSQLSPPTQPDGRSSFEKAEEMMGIAMRDGSHRFEWVHRRADGEDFWVEVSLTAIPIQDHRVIHTAWRDITDRKKAEAAIQASLDEKVILLREVHHRVKNNLQIIISLTNLQMRQTSDPAVKLIMAETQNRVKAMSLVHEKLYRSESLSRIDFADYSRFLASQLFSFYGMDTRKVRLDLNMGKIMVDINTAVPLGLLMNELVSNALKHAFPGGQEGTIGLSGGEDGDRITLIVRDNGIGIPEELDWRNTASLGMRLVTSLTDQIDGTITLDRKNGTAFTISVKSGPAAGGVE